MFKKMLAKIHSTPHHAVLAITGGGSEAIGELLRHGNGSNTLLEAVVPYDTTAYLNFVKGKPDKFCSEHAARQLAMAAYQRALTLRSAQEATWPVIGIAATCSLVKENERAGREHHIYIALQTEARTVSYRSQLTKNRDRETEETIAANLILNTIAEGCGLEEHVTNYTVGALGVEGAEMPVRAEATADEALAQLISGKTDVVTFPLSKEQAPASVIFPGSFNPIHDGHLAIIEAAAKFTKLPVSLEISVENVDKPMLDFIEINKRLAQIKALNNPHITQVHFTRAPKFINKAMLFPNTTFAVGMDTFLRIDNHDYYDGTEQCIQTLIDLDASYCAHLLVFPRNGQGEEEFKNAGKLIQGFSTLIGEDYFKPVDISSTQLRK
jgi:hypothetical protein